MIWVRSTRTQPGLDPGVWLDAAEQARAETFRQAADRDRFVTSRAVLKSLVAELAAVPVELVTLAYDCRGCARPQAPAHGRPRVSGPAGASTWHVSLAHSASVVVVAASEVVPFGVDVETIAAAGFDGFDEVARSDRERRRSGEAPHGSDAVSRSESNRSRATTWVRKEAALKAIGRGLTIDPRLLTMSEASEPARLVDWAGPGPMPAVVVADLGPEIAGAGYVAAVAHLARTRIDLRVDTQIDVLKDAVNDAVGPGPATRAGRANR